MVGGSAQCRGARLNRDPRVSKPKGCVTYGENIFKEEGAELCFGHARAEGTQGAMFRCNTHRT